MIVVYGIFGIGILTDGMSWPGEIFIGNRFCAGRGVIEWYKYKLYLQGMLFKMLQRDFSIFDGEYNQIFCGQEYSEP